MGAGYHLDTILANQNHFRARWVVISVILGHFGPFWAYFGHFRYFLVSINSAHHVILLK